MKVLASTVRLTFLPGTNEARLNPGGGETVQLPKSRSGLSANLRLSTMINPVAGSSEATTPINLRLATLPALARTSAEADCERTRLTIEVNTIAPMIKPMLAVKSQKATLDFLLTT